MPPWCVGRLALWPLLLTSIVVMLCITKLTHESSQLIFHLGGLVSFFVWVAINMVLLMRSEDHERDHNNTPENEMIIREYRATRTTPPVEGFQGTEIARLAIKALPPVKSFNDEDKTNGSQSVDCPICMEVFKNGELIQPFGLCVHEFHSSCINSWLHSGKTTCPLCREDLATSIHARGT